MPNDNKISEIKIIIKGLLQDIDYMSEEEMISSVKWEETLMSASLISQKLNTLRIEQERSHIRKIEAELRELKQKIDTPVQRREPIEPEPPEPIHTIEPVPLHTIEPVPIQTAAEEEIELDLFTDSIPIMDVARSSKPEWMRDKPGPKIDNISNAITLNDKLFFIKELFKSDEEQYYLSIQKLNSMDSLEKALDYTRTAFPDWDEESNAIYRFYMILRRRFNG